MLDFKVDPDRKTVYIYATGTVDVPQILDYLTELARDPGFTPDIDEFIDTSGIENFQVTTAQMRSLLSKYLELGMQKAGRTIVAATTDLTYGMGRALETQAQNVEMGRQIVLFRSLAEAEEFVGHEFPLKNDGND